MRKILYAISAFSIMLFVWITVVVFYWLNYPYKPLVFSDKEFSVKEHIVKRGDILHYTSNYCKYMDLPAIVTRTFVNELLFVTPSFVSNRQVECNSIPIAVTIPKELPAGHFKLKNTYQFQVNPIRKITITEFTEEFEVIDATPSGEVR